MRRFHYCGLTAVALLIASAASVPARAQGTPEEEVLKKHGLRIVGSMALAETEAPIKGKMTEARRLARQLSAAVMQQKGTMSPQQRQEAQKTITSQISQLRSEMNAATQQMNQLPRYRGRMSNSIVAGQYAQLQAYRVQLQAEINQESMFLNQLKAQGADPKAKDKLDADVRDRREAYEQALQDLRKLVDETSEKYKDVAKNDEVKKALESLSKGKTDKLKLGPSHDFTTNAKLLERLEKAAAAGETEGTPAKSTRRSSRAKRAGQSSRSVLGADSPAAAPADDAGSPQ